MKILFWIAILVLVILGALAVTHNMEIRTYRCEACGMQKEHVTVTCLGQSLHEYEPYDTDCPSGIQHRWKDIATFHERGVRAILGRDAELPEPVPEIAF